MYLRFSIGLSKKDIAILEKIKVLLVPSPSLRGGDQRGPTGDPPPGVGNISKQGSQSIQFRVRSIKDLAIIIYHFDKYPLITDKLADYKLLNKAFKIV